MILLLLEIRFIKNMETIQTKSKGKILNFKSIFISDVHLGHRKSSANKLESSIKIIDLFFTIVLVELNFNLTPRLLIL